MRTVLWVVLALSLAAATYSSTTTAKSMMLGADPKPTCGGGDPCK